MESKPIWQSKTFWANVIGIALEAIQLVSSVYVLPPGVLTISLGVLNIVLRRFTNQPVTLS